MSARLRISRVRIVVCVFVVASHLLPARQVPTYTLTGRVIDDSTKFPIENVNVFIANSTLGGPTNQQGIFRIRNVPAGTHELVASIVGYALHTSFVKLVDSSQQPIELRLRQKVVELGAVEVVGADPAEWKKDLARFTRYFFGNGPNANQCTLLNPEILSFSTNGSGTFEARAADPLRFENKGLGYEVQLRLLTLSLGPQWLTYGWRAFYSEITSVDDDQKADWQKSRLRAYKGSLRHFLASLVSGRTEKEGFSIFLVANPRLSAGRMRMPVSEEEILSPGSVSNEKLLHFQDYLEVEYSTGSALVWRGPRGIAESTSGRVSWLRLSREYVTINSTGGYVEPYSLNVTGTWSQQRVADALPTDYLPMKNE
jgi:hypothetical protein